MDSYSFASEIALRLLSIDYGKKIDDILCSPEAAAEFDRIAKEFAPHHTSFEYRWAALAIRKRATKSKSLAKNHFSDWFEKDLPRHQSVSRCKPEKHEKAGVYVLKNRTQTLYIGESLHVGNRIKQIQNTGAECWNNLGLTRVCILPTNGRPQHGLQSVLIRRFDPVLNSQLLMPNIEADVPDGKLV